MMPRLVSCAALVLLTVASTTASAANPYLQRARERYQALDYPALPGLLAEAMVQPGNTRAELVEIYRLQGFAYTINGDEASARQAFLRLLIADPDHVMDDSVSPRFRAAFTRVRTEFQREGPVTAQHQPPTRGLRVRVTLKDRFRRVEDAHVAVRVVSGESRGTWLTVPMEPRSTKGTRRTLEALLPDPAKALPDAPPGEYVLEYHFGFRTFLGDDVPVSGLEPLYRVSTGGGEDTSSSPRWPWIAAGATSGGVGLAVLLAGAAVSLGGAVLLGQQPRDDRGQFLASKGENATDAYVRVGTMAALMPLGLVGCLAGVVLMMAGVGMEMAGFLLLRLKE
ncbi:MAG: hypothetical protein AB2A00_22850 [Myxococcota bacterium]